jgi:hypothetical protein
VSTKFALVFLDPLFKIADVDQTGSVVAEGDVLWPLLLRVLPYQSIQAQEVHHAPTVEPCRADQKVWLSKLNEPHDAGTANVNFPELFGWMREMLDCAEVDPPPHDRYAITALKADTVMIGRFQFFIMGTTNSTSS